MQWTFVFLESIDLGFGRGIVVKDEFLIGSEFNSEAVNLKELENLIGLG